VICLSHVDFALKLYMLWKKMFKQWWPSILPVLTKRTLISYLIWTHWTQRNTMTYDVWNLGSGLGQPQKCCGVKPFNRITTLPSCNCNTDINKWLKKPAEICFHSKKITYYHKNECQHKHGQYNNRVNENVGTIC
jgi:hypothetical protein